MSRRRRTISAGILTLCLGPTAIAADGPAVPNIPSPIAPRTAPIETSPPSHRVDPITTLPIAPGFEQVRLHCTGCHSGRLVAQNRATREGWRELIRWMQRTQRLPDLGTDEETILDYLAAQLGPELSRPPRRARLGASLLPPSD